MKFAVRIPAGFLYPYITSEWEKTATPADVLHFARKVDGLDFDWVWLPEHVIMPNESAPFMGPRFHEALTAAAFILGATARVKALTYIVPLPYHNPVVYAKAIASLDYLSGGRITPGLAVGHMEREFDIMGVPFHDRGAMADEYLRAMKELWVSDAPSFHGKYVQFEDVTADPKPVQKPHPPLMIGGDSRPALRRAASLGDGWLPWLTTRDEIPARLRFIREQPDFARRTRPFEVLALLADFPAEDRLNLSRFRIPRARDEVLDLAGAAKDAGATGLIVHLPSGTSGLDECLEWVEWFSREIIPAVQG